MIGVFATPSWAAPLFGEPRTYPVGSSPVGIAAGEFSATAGLDLVTVDEGNTLSFLTNQGSGVFVPSAPLPIADRYGPTAIASGHLNTDGRDDLVIAANDNDTPDFSGAVVLYQSTNTALYSATAYTVGLFPTCVALAELNGDGLADVVSCGTTADGSGLISLLRHNADNSFAGAGGVSLGAITPNRLVAGDIDGDLPSLSDLIVVDTNANAVWILYAHSPNGFDAPVRLANVDVPTAAVLVPLADHALPSVAVASRSTNSVLVFRQSSPRVFGSPDSYPVGLFPVDLAAADVDGNGASDLLVANNGSNDVKVLIGDGTGAFQASENVGVGNGPVAIVVGDFNGDGKPDFATANQDDVRFGEDTQSVSVVLNGVSPAFTPTPSPTMTASAAPTSAATLTATATRTATTTWTPTITRTPTAGGVTPTPTVPGDVNCDGRVTTDDLVTIIERIFDGTSGCLTEPVSAADVTRIVQLLGQ